MIRLKARFLDIEPNYSMVVLNVRDAGEIGANRADRVKVRDGGKDIVVSLETTRRLVRPGYIGLNRKFETKYGIRSGVVVEVAPAEKPRSVEYIKKKLAGRELTKKECRSIIDDINDNKLSDVELGAYVAAVYVNDYTPEELAAVTEMIVETGDRLSWPSKNVVDKHSIGGVPGGRTTPIVVSMVAAAGLVIPKTSSRAITSPAGTADTMEALCRVGYGAKDIQRIVKRTGACFVWGGALDVAPADDKIIRAEYPLSLDPEGQVIASVLAKKKAMGSRAVVIDIPFGPETKVESLEAAERLAARFKEAGKKLGLRVDCALTRGEQPVGRGIGPVLECIDLVDVLNGKGPDDLREKAVEIGGILLRLMKKGGRKKAEELLRTGKALKKFRQIVRAQDGNPDRNLRRMLGRARFTVKTTKSGWVVRVRNMALSRIARIAGAPADKGAGIYLHAKLGDKVKRGDKLFEVYAEKPFKLAEARLLVDELAPVTVEARKKMLVEEV